MRCLKEVSWSVWSGNESTCPLDTTFARRLRSRSPGAHSGRITTLSTGLGPIVVDSRAAIPSLTLGRAVMLGGLTKSRTSGSHTQDNRAEQQQRSREA